MDDEAGLNRAEAWTVRSAAVVMNCKFAQVRGLACRRLIDNVARLYMIGGKRLVLGYP